MPLVPVVEVTAAVAAIEFAVSRLFSRPWRQVLRVPHPLAGMLKAAALEACELTLTVNVPSYARTVKV